MELTRRGPPTPRCRVRVAERTGELRPTCDLELLVDMRQVQRDGRVRIKTDGALDALMVQITLAPGGTGGWHTHAIPLVTIVKEGTLTIVDADCQPHQVSAGHAAILPGSLGKDENLGNTPVTFEVTFLIPDGAGSPRIDAPAPAGCSA